MRCRSRSFPLFLFLLVCFPRPSLGIFDALSDLGLVDWNDLFGSFFDLFLGKRKIQCSVKFLLLRATAADKQFYRDKFRDDSVMILSESGNYIGPEAIAEYIGFAYQETSPFVDAGPVTTATQYRVVGYDDSTGQCEVIRYQVDAYVLNPVLTESETIVSISVLNSLFMDYKESYLTRINIFYTKPFLNWYFGEQFNTNTIRKYICNDILDQSCGESNVAACETILDGLPAATGDAYVDGNSLGCRVLHSAFAVSNPEAHCPHVTLDTTDADSHGIVKCSNSDGVTPLDLFRAEDIDAYKVWAGEQGLDPELGFQELDTLPSEV